MNFKNFMFWAGLLCLAAVPLHAQEAEMEVAFGTVVEISASQIVIMEYDFVADKEKEAVYFINDETKYENVESMAQISAFDSVRAIDRSSRSGAPPRPGVADPTFSLALFNLSTKIICCRTNLKRYSNYYNDLANGRRES